MEIRKCPSCGAWNPNTDFPQAVAQLHDSNHNSTVSAPICYVIAVEEYGQMVVYGPQYRVLASAQADVELPQHRGQKAEIWACYPLGGKE